MIKNNLLAILIYAGLGFGIFWVGRISTNAVGSKQKNTDHHASDSKQEEKPNDHTEAASMSDLPKLSHEMKVNMGILVKELETKDFFKNIEIPALIKSTESNSFILTAYSNGIVTKINKTEGEFIKKGTVVGNLIIEARPYPTYEEVSDYYKNKNIELILSSLNQSNEASTDYLTPYLSQINIDKTEFEKLKTLSIPEQQEAIFVKITDSLGLWKKNLKNFFLKMQALPGNTIPDMVPVLVMLNRLGYLDHEKQNLIIDLSKNKKEVMNILSLVHENQSIDIIKDFASKGYLSESVEIKAPIDGILVSQNMNLGKSVSSQDILFKIIDISSLSVEVQLRGSEISYFKEAITKRLQIKLKSYQNNDQIELEFYGLNTTDSGQLTALFNFKNSLLENTHIWQYYPGDQCELLIPEKSFPQSMTLPREALIEEGFKRFVFMENGDNFEKVEVTTSFIDKNIVVLSETNSLFEGDRIVIQGAYELNLATKKPEKSSGDGHNHSH